MKTNKEAENIFNHEITNKPLQNEKVEKENKTTPNFTCKDFQNFIKKTDNIFLTSDTPDNFFPYELYKEAEVPLSPPDKPDNSND